MHLTHGEKRLLLVACIAGCALGAFGGYLAFAEAAENQFHGGILEEDATEAMRHLIQSTVVALVTVGSASVLVIGVIPIWLRRLLHRRLRGN